MQRPFLALALCAAPLVFSGCSSLLAGAKQIPPGPRAFDFATDTLARPVPEPAALDNREPLADPALRGWAEAHVARQFFLHARFDPAATPPTSERRLALVREILTRDPAGMSTEARRVVIPGYASLREFSRLQGHLVRAESWLVCAGAHRAPLANKAFGATGGSRAVAQVTATVTAQRPAVVRLHRHRQLDFDRALLLYEVKEDAGKVRFTAYDPAAPGRPVELAFDRASRAFALSDDLASRGAALGVTLQ